jgi:hypothetical protein
MDQRLPVARGHRGLADIARRQVVPLPCGPIPKSAANRADSAETVDHAPPKLPSHVIATSIDRGALAMQTFAAVTMHRSSSIVAASHAARRDDSVETQLWLEEHDWLHALQRSPQNVSPTFRFPDLISACVSLVFADAAAGARIFAYLGQELVLRDPRTPRRREYLWREQFQMLRALQMSEANRHPNPMFQLDQLTTACVALVRQSDAAAEQVLRQARRNVALRTARRRESSPTA